MNRNEIIELLKAGTCEVIFQKVNGETRVMTCTRKPLLIPTEHHPKTANAVENHDTVKAFDINAQGWRSFRVDLMESILVVDL